ncbi:MAG: hypothetical protein CM1200mP18_02790 [Gammaproteobacteria bacterium]|nr:MAG: hypothetical protein CM1200mP18_02790 [Gammaproteobacteria bacterium]
MAIRLSTVALQRTTVSGSQRKRCQVKVKLLCPGFVNCHSHAASALFRSQSDDGVGGQALYSVAFRSEKHISNSAVAGSGSIGSRGYDPVGYYNDQ